MQLAINTVVAGRFRLNHLIGRGGMGSVWHATHLGLDIPCAVKFIEGENAQSPEAQARFEREAKAAAQLRSPNVVQVLDHGLCEGTPYIAMELLDGEDLGKRLARVQRMHPLELHAIVNHVCRALSKAHALGIVHRDLKPDNIFLVRDDDREIGKVLDFGIAKSSSQQLGVSSTTKTGAMLGTPYYMSPEQAQGTKQVDGRSDLWALAVICFRALTGKLPFTSEALGDLLMKIIIGPIPVPSQYAPVPDGFDRWWMKATAREPSERFQSAKDFADSLALVCGVSQVSGIIDRPNMRVVAHQTGAGVLPPSTATYADPATQTAQPGAARGGVPYGHTAAPATDPMPGPSQNPAMGQTPAGQARAFHVTGQPIAPTGQSSAFGSSPGATGGAPAGVPPFAQTSGSHTPATFGESLAGPPKKTNIGIVIGVGAAVAVCLLLGIGLAVWRNAAKPSGEDVRTTAGPSVPSASAIVATDPPPAPPASGAAAVDPSPVAPSSAQAPEPAAPIGVDPQALALPAPMPPSTSSSGGTTAAPPPSVPSVASAKGPSASAPTADAPARPSSHHGSAPHPQVGKKGHEDLGF